jgi:hypothetical protein
VLSRQRPRWSASSCVLLLLAMVLGLAGGVLPAPGAGAQTADAPRAYGTLQSSPDRLAATTAAGVDLATLEVSWRRFETSPGVIDTTYRDELRTSVSRFRDAGVDVVLSPGVHYTPDWLLSQDNSRFVNQYGDSYAPTETGKKIANMVFNQAMRDRQQAYLARLFAELGTDFFGVRLGGGWYGELNYPDPGFAGRSNGYWGFDRIALGLDAGLPPGLAPNPVPGWLPGTPSVDHEAARRFADWYLGSLQDYHDWQIETVRSLYPGRLLMMYPSWGIRPGQLDAAVAGDLSGSTSAERNGEVQRGFDFARYVGGITDPGVVVYTTWLNADASADGGTDMRYWSPVKYLAHLAQDRTQPLRLMGENTGRDTVADMTVTFEQARAHSLIGVVWAFEPELFSGGHATVEDLTAAIAADKARSSEPPTLAASTTLPGTVSGAAYQAQVAVVGGTAPFRWQAEGLPTGLGLTATGDTSATVSGATTAIGDHLVGLRVTDAEGRSATVSRTLTVRRPPTWSGDLPSATRGSTYRQQLTGADGYPPYTWSPVSLPSGLSLSTTGELSGKPRDEGVQQVRVLVEDSRGFSSDVIKPLTVSVGSSPGSRKKQSWPVR